MGLRPCGRGQFTILGENGARPLATTLAQKIIPCVDKIRDLNTKFGMRPYLVRQVWTRWSGGERGYGVEDVVMENLMLPTPRIDLMTALDKQATVIGDEEFGELMLTEISGTWTEDGLCGRGYDGSEIPLDLNFYYEVEYMHQGGTPGPSTKRRFAVSGTPGYDPGNFQWKLLLMRAGENRLRSGTPED